MEKRLKKQCDNDEETNHVLGNRRVKVQKSHSPPANEDGSLEQLSRVLAKNGVLYGSLDPTLWLIFCVSGDILRSPKPEASGKWLHFSYLSYTTIPLVQF